MTTTIKFTQLASIGANLAANSIVPVVNMANIPITEKTTVGAIANLTLEEAGNIYVPAGLALVALEVANAAQPNITSVGTLTSLDVTGDITANNIGNIASINIDGASSNVLLGDGTFGQVPLYPNALVWTTAPTANTDPGTTGEVAYDSGGNLFICVATNTWSKIIGTTSW